MLTNSYRKLQRGDLDPARPEKLEQYIAGLERLLDSMAAQLDDLRARRAGELTLPDLLRIKAALEQGGAAQLDITNLPGIPAETLDTRIPRVSSHPDPYSTPYDTYILTGTPDGLWTIDRSTNPPTASQIAFVSTHNLLSSTHTDVVASAVSRGSLIKGNATPAWEELAIGAANTLPVSDGTDFSWTTVPDAALSSNVALENAANIFTAGQTFDSIIKLTGTAVVGSGSSPYTMGADDLIVLANTSSGAITINLPVSSNTNRLVVVKDVAGNAAANNVTIDGNGGDTIDGALTKVINTNFGVYWLLDAGSGSWSLL